MELILHIILKMYFLFYVFNRQLTKYILDPSLMFILSDANVHGKEFVFPA